MRIARGGWPFILGSVAVFGCFGAISRAFGWGYAEPVSYLIGLITCGFMVYFFRDPERKIPADASDVLSGADGWIRSVETMAENNYLHMETVRISTFLTPFDVHVNRAPIRGRIEKLAYTPGQHLLTIRQASSERNEHSSILIEGDHVRCLVKQIVGPIVRRVVYWLQIGQEIGKGERIGIMKFGSRLDIYLPADAVDVVVRKGDRVFAGKTVIAILKGESITS